MFSERLNALSHDHHAATPAVVQIRRHAGQWDRRRARAAPAPLRVLIAVIRGDGADDAGGLPAVYGIWRHRPTVADGRLVCPVSLIAEGQASDGFAGLRIVADRGMSYLTEGLIDNARVQEKIFLSVNNIPIDQIGFYRNRSVIVIGGAASGKNDDRDSRCVVRYSGNREAIIFKRSFFCVNFVVARVGCNTVGAIDYKGVRRRLVPGVAEWDRDSNGPGRRSTWYSAERRTDRTDPSPVGSNQCHVCVVGGKLGYD